MPSIHQHGCVSEGSRWLSESVCGQHSMCFIGIIVYIYLRHISTQAGVRVRVDVNTPSPALSSASGGVDLVRSGFTLTALQYVNRNFAPTGCLFIMTISRSQCCLYPIRLAGDPSPFVLILSLIRLEEPTRISCAGFLEVCYFLILIIIGRLVISRSHSLCFPHCLRLLAAFLVSLHSHHTVFQSPPLPHTL